MALRIHEIHPSLVHFPLALVPAALVLDTIGRVTGNRTLMEAGRRLMPVGAVSAIVTGLAGLVAQQSVRAEGRAHELLATHRNLNALLVAATALLARRRFASTRPGWGYLLAGFGGVAAMSYTAYLGGKLVYAHGVGVEPAAGVRTDASLEIRRGSMARAARLSAEHAVHGFGEAAREIGGGEIAPALRRQAGDATARGRKATRRAGQRGRKGDSGQAAPERSPVTGYGGTLGGYGSGVQDRDDDRRGTEGPPPAP